MICFNVQLFSVDSPSPQWDDVGPFDLDDVMAVAEDIAAPYTQVVLFHKINVMLVVNLVVQCI